MHLSVVKTLPNALAVPHYVAQEEQVIAQALFQNFVHEEFQQEGLDDVELLPEDMQAQGDQQFIDENFDYAQRQLLGSAQTIEVRRLGVKLRNLAIAFARSPQRRCVQRHADEIDLATMTYENYWTLLEEVFRHGVNGSNLIALFYFCSDVLKRCVQNKLRELGLNLFKWALKYIIERVCKWVNDRGGWEIVCKTAINSKYLRYCAIGILAVTVWLTVKRFSR